MSKRGRHPLPADHDGSLKMLLHRSRLLFRDSFPSSHPPPGKRRPQHEVLTEETRGKRPRYYLQNFHFQSGGWMTDRGPAQPVRCAGRSALQRRRRTPRGVRRCRLLHVTSSPGLDLERRLMLLDVGCGTGRFLDFVKQTWPRLPALGLDLFRGPISGRPSVIYSVGRERTLWWAARRSDSAAGREPGRGNEHLHVP